MSTQQPRPARPGEVFFSEPLPAGEAAGLVFIGRLRSPFGSFDECPKNRRAALEAGGGGSLEVDRPWREALVGLSAGDHVFCLSWLGSARRDLALQKPRHAETARGTFSLRSPARPNPIGLHLVRIEAIDADAGILHLDAIDVLDGTPLIDIKPYFASVDRPAED
ncbi:tRNA (N6-threonylcarbamoyladenosine(37)-N6)-methyltransferase TrmO [Jiella pelagia]|uniref:tRNA (N6-threonylcarbamoyladenosine(37)-N6)-methyltransferase TrmO n=1 Tax=Jiella pelagia TaxID=2986949 RepID=A0ABY7C1F0_9HYPH|nr:tRNA (N6-threonylcarbamoyladenosine(37)-N6)-methyltransferase TrmO [Jiella pelagia]WAP69684.1 tRNA (N6-threonylcarbamoyladenosine(37)-N6)-methyltransferase TrmO [Jiella pelagia]